MPASKVIERDFPIASAFKVPSKIISALVLENSTGLAIEPDATIISPR